MDKKDVVSALTEINEKGKNRNFNQTIELIISLRQLLLNRPEAQLNLRVKIPHATGKEQGKALLFIKKASSNDEVSKLFSKVVFAEDLPKYNKKTVGELLTFDSLFAYKETMLDVAKYLGQELAPKGKMPKPLLTLDVPTLRAEIRKGLDSVTITNKKGKILPMLQTVVGTERMGTDEMAENILMIYDEVVKALPKAKENVKAVIVKKTMGKPVKIKNK